MADLQSAAPLEEEQILGGPKLPIMNYTVGLSSGEDHQVKTLLSGRILQGPGDHLLEAKSKGQTSLWRRLIFYYILLETSNLHCHLDVQEATQAWHVQHQLFNPPEVLLLVLRWSYTLLNSHLDLLQ